MTKLHSEAEYRSQDHYRAQAREVDLLSFEEEQQLAKRMQLGNQAFTVLMNRIRPFLVENFHNPLLQKMMQSIQQMVPANFIESIRRIENIQLSDDALHHPTPSIALFHTTLDITAQKIAVYNELMSPRLLKEDEEGNYSHELLSLISEIIDLVEETVIPFTKENASVAQRDSIGTRELVIHSAEEAREQMFRANMRLVLSIANRYSNQGIDSEDLISEGNIGLMKAVEYFDPTRGFKFSTYATNWIKQSIVRAMVNNRSTVRVPVHLQETAHTFRQRLSALCKQEMRPIGEQEALALLEYTENQATSIMKTIKIMDNRSLSFEYSNTSRDGGLTKLTTLENRIVNVKSESPEQQLEDDAAERLEQDVFKFFESLLLSMLKDGTLNEREAEILRMRSGMRFQNAKTLQEVGEMFEVTRERIRQLEYIAEWKLRTQIDIIQNRRESIRNGTNRSHPELKDVFLSIEQPLRGGMRGKRKNFVWNATEKRQIEALLSISCNEQAKQLVRAKLELDELNLDSENADEHSSTKAAQKRLISSTAASWMKAAVEEPGIGANTAKAIPEFHTEQGIKNYLEMFRMIRDILADGSPLLEDKATFLERRKFQEQKCIYFKGIDAVFDMEILVEARAKQTISPSLESLPPDKRLARLLKEAGKVDSTTDPHVAAVAKITSLLRETDGEILSEKEGKKYPLWMRKLTEPVATQLHTLLMQNPSADTLKLFFQRTYEMPLSAAESEKILMDCLFQTEKTMENLREFLQFGNAIPEKKSSQYVGNLSVINAFEKNEIIIPNLRRIIETHFEKNPKPVKERVLVDVGAWDGRVTTAIADLFGHIIALEANPTPFKKLAEHQSEHFEVMQGSVENLALTPEFFTFKGDVILMSDILYSLQFEQDESALMWAQSALREKGISISILNDRVAEPGSRAHLHQKMKVRERHPSPARYRDFMTNRGFPAEVAQASLLLQNKSNEGYKAMREMMRFMLPQSIQNDTATLDAYMEKYVKGKGEDGRDQIRQSLFFLVAHEDTNANHSMPKIHIKNRPTPKEQYGSLFQTSSQQNEDISLLPSIPKKEPVQESTNQVQSKIIKRKLWKEQTAPTKETRSYEREDVQNTVLYQRLRGRLIRLVEGRKFKTRIFEQAHYYENKKRFSEPERVHNPKVTKRLNKEIAEVNAALLEARKNNIYAVSPKTGEIMVNGIECVQLEKFAQLYSLNSDILKQAVAMLKIEPEGWALRVDSEEQVLAMGYHTKVYPLKALLQIPYVRKKVSMENAAFMEMFGEDFILEAPSQTTPFLRELDAAIMEEREADINLHDPTSFSSDDADAYPPDLVYATR
jgi:RNA polymerase primary sigma factor